MSWGQSSKFFEELKKQGKKLGAGAGRVRPRIPPMLAPYWRAFTDLHRRRQWHQSGPQPISYQEMESYARLKFRVGLVQVQRMVRFIEDLDDAYLVHFAEKQAKETAKK